MNKTVILAQQIAQGMGYLHHRNIVHKDLKTKNIFLENGKAIITDFGLVNVTRRLCARQVGFGASLAERFVSHYSKSQIFVQRFNFDKTPTFSRVFHPKFFGQFFS